jgi:phosphoethanolamine N-methyltransferase
MTDNTFSDEWTNGKQYASSGIRRYERLFGKNFISSGGLATTEMVVKKMMEMGLKPGDHVLDIGSGLGGSAYYLHDKAGARVTGVDLSPPMYKQAVANIDGRTGINFILGYAEEQPFEDESFDFVYSRDCLIHVDNKARMLSFVHRVLKKGGIFFLTDYCFRNDEENLAEEYKNYVKDTNYFLISFNSYRKVIEAAGFELTIIDWTDVFDETLKNEMDRVNSEKEEFIKELSQEDYDYLIDRWTAKRRMVAAGDFKWGFYICKKPN